MHQSSLVTLNASYCNRKSGWINIRLQLLLLDHIGCQVFFIVFQMKTYNESLVQVKMVPYYKEYLQCFTRNKL